MARKGHKHKLGFEGGQIPLIRRIPKRGFKNPTRQNIRVFNISDLDRFEDGSVVDMQKLRSAGLLRGACDGVKILGDGELKKKLIVKANAFSVSAKTAIEAAGGSCEVVIK